MSEIKNLKQAIEHHDEMGALTLLAQIETILNEIIPALENGFYVRPKGADEGDPGNTFLDSPAFSTPISKAQVMRLRDLIK